MEKKLNKRSRPSVKDLLGHVRHYLPAQGPIKDFIHHNTLHMFQDKGLTFHEAVRQASRLYGANEYLPIAEYRARYAAGRIGEHAIGEVLRLEGGDSDRLRESMLHGEYAAVVRRPSFRDQGYLADMVRSSHIILEEQVHPIVYRLVANYLDQGIAAISLSEHEGSFWQILRAQLVVARPFGVSAGAAELIRAFDAEELIGKMLSEMLPANADHDVFLLEVLMAARGWSGVIAQIEERPESLNYRRPISLLEYVALYLAVLRAELNHAGFKPDAIAPENPNLKFFKEESPVEDEAETVSRLWHESMEMSFYLESIAVIASNAKSKRSRSAAEGKARLQAVFCIDDRECSLRRYLEELSDTIETFGTPGFFGIDAVYQGPYDAISIKQCPVPVTPRHRLRGTIRGKRKISASRVELNFWHRHANRLWLGWIISTVFGAVSMVRLALSVHRPSKSFATASSFAASDDLADLHYERPDGAPQSDGYFDGYTVAEMAERVGRVLRQIGLTRKFAPLVVMAGHGSTSTNNPYFAAYDCGACSGRPGLVNARAFALMANRHDVRALLKKNRIDIPATTLFVGAIHDTARDEILFLDTESLSESQASQLKDCEALFERALLRNAHERVRRFAIVDFPRTHEKALREARVRTEMLFEPRPEYNHATNAMAIVGRRSLTENLFLDRRAFFNSYDPDADKDGSILNGILTPLVPVCGGINLEYLFSRVDNRIYGAGSKLPHNVFALIGVGNGSEGDLRTGLPEQMIEIHDPVRLMIVVEQRKEIVLKVIKQNAGVRQWIENGWVKFCIFDHHRGQFFWYDSGKFSVLGTSGLNPPAFNDSFAAYDHQRGNIAPALLKRGR